MTNTTNSDGEDVTLAADDDVVAKIRAHAAQLRAEEDVKVWTAPESEIGVSPAPIDVAALSLARADAATRSLKPASPAPVADAPRTLEDLDDEVTVPAGDYRALLGLEPKVTVAHDNVVDDDVTAPPVARPAVPIERPAVQAVGEPGVSLIDGMAPPAASTTFWTDEKQFRASGIDAPLRPERRSRIPLWILITLVVLLIVAASVGIALAVASTGPVT